MEVSLLSTLSAVFSKVLLYLADGLYYSGIAAVSIFHHCVGHLRCVGHLLCNLYIQIAGKVSWTRMERLCIKLIMELEGKSAFGFDLLLLYNKAACRHARPNFNSCIATYYTSFPQLYVCVCVHVFFSSLKLSTFHMWSGANASCWCHGRTFKRREFF